MAKKDKDSSGRFTKKELAWIEAFIRRGFPKRGAKNIRSLAKDAQKNSKSFISLMRLLELNWHDYWSIQFLRRRDPPKANRSKAIFYGIYHTMDLPIPKRFDH